MTSDWRLTLLPWLTLDATRQVLTDFFNGPVSEAHVLRLGLDGRLKLSVFLPEGTIGDGWNLDDIEIPVDPMATIRVDPTLPTTGRCETHGVWDLPMVAPGSLQIENRFNQLSGLPQRQLEGLGGAFVERPDTLCKLRAEGSRYTSPPSVIPHGSEVVVRTDAILECLKSYSQLSGSAAADDLSRPLLEKERGNLLIIIAALCKTAGIDISQRKVAATKILEAIDTLKPTVPGSLSGIQIHLRRIPDVLDRRSKQIDFEPDDTDTPA